MSKVKQVKAIENGKGIQYLIDAAKTIFHNPISVTDTNYRLIAFTDDSIDDPIWTEMTSTGTFSMKTQKFFAKESFTENIANADKCTILKSDELKYDRMASHIFNRENVKIGLASMYECYTSFDEEIQVAFELFADKISGEIRNDEYFTAFGRIFHEDMINKLLDGVISDPLLYTPHIQVLYDGFEDYIYVAVVDVSRSGDGQNNLEYFKNLLINADRSYKYAIYSDYIVVIMSSKQKYVYEKLFFNKHRSLFKENNLFAGVSSGFENLYELRDYYDEAVAALKNVIEYDGTGVFFYNKYREYPKQSKSKSALLTFNDLNNLHVRNRKFQKVSFPAQKRRKPAWLLNKTGSARFIPSERNVCSDISNRY